MAGECAGWLEADRKRVLVDATVGGGGHAAELARRMRKDGLLVIVDALDVAVETATERLRAYGVQVMPIVGNFRNLAEMLRERGLEEVDGVLYDQGLSSADFEGDRGYSFRGDAPLDMRRDATATRSAADLVNTLDRRQLAHLLREFGDERWADRIARAVVERRAIEPITRTAQLVSLIEQAVPRAAWPRDIHVATRTMMALRFAVNDDVGAIQQSIEGIAPMLSEGGRIVCLSYCSTEDRAVKHVFRRMENPCTCPRGLAVCACGRKPLLRVLTKRGVRPGSEELQRNRRARSAIARVAERVRARANNSQ